MLTPLDYKETRDHWEAQGKGACGPCSIATAVGSTVSRVIEDWEGGYKGTANVGEIERELARLGKKTRRYPGKRARQFSMPPNHYQALAFIQWGEYKHWIEAQKHTHWVYMEVWNNDLHIFCNGEEGWFSASSKRGRDYLLANNGRIRSYLAIA